MRHLIPLVVLSACWQTTTTEITPDPLPEPWASDAAVAASYTLTFPEARSQYLDVEAVFPGTGDTLDLFVATWTPGSYVVRDYASHIESVSASTSGGQPLSIEKTTTNRWRVQSKDAEDVVVRYKVYSAELSVRGNWIETDLAVLNGAPTYIAAVDRLDKPHDVRILRPDSWTGLHTSLAAHPSDESHRFRAASYDVLVDSPVILGETTVHDFDVDGVVHRLVNLRENDGWDGAKSATDVERITRTQVAFWRGMPYRSYHFLNVTEGTRGGLEHKGSTLMMASRWATQDDDTYKKWLGLVSHEFFHTWNVKRMRPVELGPFNYEAQTTTRSLWIAEGITSYYDDLLLARAGLLTDAEYLERMNKNVEQVGRKPGRFVRSLEDSSFDAWIKYYKKDANHDNVSVSYYVKGAVVGWMLDAEIRKASNGSASLDDAMRDVYALHSKSAGYTPQDFQRACESRAGTTLDPFFESYVRGTEEIDLSTVFQVFGLRNAPPVGPVQPTRKNPNPTQVKKVDDPPIFGARLSGNKVVGIVRDSPAWKGGIIAEDEIIAVDGYRVRALKTTLKRYNPSDELSVLLSRRDKLLTIQVTLDAPTEAVGKLEPDPDASPPTREARATWLGPQLTVSGRPALPDQIAVVDEVPEDTDAAKDVAPVEPTSP
ncbi:MAG: putative metalloprotease with PDZ domain [Kiritimatiellia bacterium]|jgi:predicted metalloprotease with PDZ domain